MAQAAVDEQKNRRHHPVRRWCFTINNYTAAEEEAVRGLAADAKYLICGREIGENGTPHLQGYVNLKKTCRMSSLKARLGGRGHFEPARGDDSSNRDYCSKGGDLLIESGDVQSKGKRNDLHSAVEILRASGSLSQVARSAPEAFVKYHRGLAALLLMSPELTTPRSWKTEVIVYSGPPGCGKSRLCFEMAPSAYWKPRGKWWDGYDGHSDIILDDFYGWLPFDDLLRLCDRYPLRVETKGGTVQFVGKRILITSNKLPHEWYTDEVYNKDALFRRLDSVFYYEIDKFVSPPFCVFPHRICY
ncbi:replication associated protein [Banfec circovirus 2]|uniref:replication associated protein n=1 Tax=Banfec circovirus 2 TaxID=3038664 RepID=UPI004019E332|nr:replication associated protein [Banfec circovirus 2]